MCKNRYIQLYASHTSQTPALSCRPGVQGAAPGLVSGNCTTKAYQNLIHGFMFLRLGLLGLKLLGQRVYCSEGKEHIPGRIACRWRCW